MPVLPGDEPSSSTSSSSGISKPPVRKTSSDNPPPSTSNRTNLFSSLPRSVGHRTLPSLPESGPLVRSPSGGEDSMQQSQSQSPVITEMKAEDETNVTKRPNKLDIWYVKCDFGDGRTVVWFRNVRRWRLMLSLIFFFCLTCQTTSFLCRKRRDDVGTSRPKSDASPAKNQLTQVRR